MSADLTVVTRKRTRTRAARVGLYVFLTVMAIGWLIPIGSALYASLRPYSETQKYGGTSKQPSVSQNPASAASMLDCGSETMFMEKLKFCRNHTTMVPIKMTENAQGP